MLLGNKARFYLFLVFSFLICVSTGYSQREIIEFFSSIAGERNFIVDFSIYFHVYDEEKQNYSDFEMSMFTVVRDMADFYVKVKKPEVVNDITFVYYSDSNRIYSGYDDKFYMDSVEIPDDIIIKIVNETLDVLSSPFFIYKREKVENGDVLYTFSLSSAIFLRKLGIEPISVSVVFSNDKLREITINGEKNDYVKIILNELKAGINVDNYFPPDGY